MRLVTCYFLARMVKTLLSVGGHDFFARQDLNLQFSGLFMSLDRGPFASCSKISLYVSRAFMTAVQRFQPMIVNVSGAELGWRYGQFTLEVVAPNLFS